MTDPDTPDTLPATVPNPGAEVAVLLGDLEVAPLHTPREILKAITAQGELPEQDAEDSVRQIIARILAADTVEDILRRDAVHAGDVLDVPLEITAVKWQSSAYELGANCYAVMDAVNLATGEQTIVTCGAVPVQTQLLRLWVGGMLPITAMIVRSVRPTKAGFYPMWLAPA